MRATGIIRKVDDLGRVIIPKEIRQNLNIKEGDALELNVLNEWGKPEVILRKYETSDISFEERCAEYVREKKDIITGVFYTEDRTTVMTSQSTGGVKRQPDDDFNINVAICYALARMGYKAGNPAVDR